MDYLVFLNGGLLRESSNDRDDDADYSIDRDGALKFFFTIKNSDAITVLQYKAGILFKRIDYYLIKDIEANDQFIYDKKKERYFTLKAFT